MKELKELLQEIDDLFPKKKNQVLSNYIIKRYPDGWMFSVITNWLNWHRRGLKYRFGLYKDLERGLKEFLRYVKRHRVDVKKLAKSEIPK